MSIDPSQHAENRNPFERLLRSIPGFRGYLEMGYRREADSLQRQWLADRLERSKRGLDRVSQALAGAGQIDVLPQVDRLRGRLDRTIARIRGAMPGYSGFFDLVQVDEELLDRVYQFDVNLMDQVEVLAESAEKLPTEPDAIAAGLPELHRQIDAFEAVWDRREDMLAGLE
jgi:hypothetical protein